MADRVIRIIIDSRGAVTGATHVDRSLDRVSKSANVANLALARLQRTLLGLGAAFLTARGFKEIVSGLGNVIIATDKIDNALLAAAGSAEGAAREFEFVRNISKELGADLRVTALAYSNLAAASRGTNLEGAQTREIFRAIQVTMTSLGRSAADTEGALRAIQQVISKGNVQAEELRGQLGERIPGAFQIAARAMGVTAAELSKLVELGEVTAEDLLPKMAKELIATFGGAAEQAAGRLRAQVNRLTTAFFELQQEIVSGPLTESFSSAIKEISRGISEFSQSGTIESIGKGLSNIIDLSIGTATALFGINNPLDENADRYEALARAINFTVAALTALIAVKAITFLTELGTPLIARIANFIALRNTTISLNALLAEQAIITDTLTAAMLRQTTAGSVLLKTVAEARVKSFLLAETSRTKALGVRGAVTSPLKVPSIGGAIVSALGGPVGLGITGAAIGGGLLFAYRKEIQALLDPLERVRQELDRQERSVDSARDKLSGLVSQYSSLAEKTFLNVSEQIEFNRVIKEATGLFPELTNVMDGTTSSIDKLNQAFGELQLEQQLQLASTSLREAREEVERFNKIIAVPIRRTAAGFGDEQSSQRRRTELAEGVDRALNEARRAAKDLEVFRKTGFTQEEIRRIIDQITLPAILPLRRFTLPEGKSPYSPEQLEEFSDFSSDITNMSRALEQELSVIGLEGSQLRIRQAENEADQRVAKLDALRNEIVNNEKLIGTDLANALIDQANQLRGNIDELFRGQREQIIKDANDELLDIVRENNEELSTVNLDGAELRIKQTENEYDERLRKTMEFGDQLLSSIKGNNAAREESAKNLSDALISIEDAKSAKIERINKDETDRITQIHKDAVEEIGGVLDQLSPSYERDVASIETWKERIAGELDKNAGNYEQMMQELDRAYFLQIEEARRQDLENSKDWQAGLIRANQRIVDSIQDQASRFEDVWLETYTGLRENTARFLLGMEQSWDQYFQNIQLMIAQNALDQLIFNPIAQSIASSGSNARFEQGNKQGGVGNFFGGLFGGLFGGGGIPFFDNGGVNTKPGLFYSTVPEVHIPIAKINQAAAQNNQTQTYYIDNRTTIETKDYTSFKATEDQTMNRIALKQKRAMQRNRV